MKVTQLRRDPPVILNRTFSGQHNHAPLSKARLHPEVHQKVKTMLLNGSKPSQVHRRLVAGSEGKDISTSVLNKNAIRQQKFRLKHASSPSHDTIKNIIAMHGPNGSKFVRYGTWFPFHGIVFCHPDGLEFLVKHGTTIMVDSTFDIINFEHNNLSLVTVMVLYKGIGVPTAFYITDSQSTDSYLLFLNQLKVATGNRWAPLYVLTDYEDALKSACITCFSSSASVLGDSFHFLQANRRWLVQHKCPDVDTVVRQLRELMVLPKAAFETQLEVCKEEWRIKYPDYLQYFSREWLNRHPIDTWLLSIANRRDAPSGDQQLEAWHRALKEAVDRLREQPDIAASFLLDEWKYYYTIITTPVLLAQQLHDVNTKNRTLTAPLAESTDKPNPNIDLATQPTGPQKCLQCNLRPSNNQCSAHRCKQCCIASSSTCSVSSHSKHIAAFHSPSKSLQVIQEAIKTKLTSVWIKYLGGSTKGRIRQVELTRWCTPNVSFWGYSDGDRSLEKRYMIKSVAEVRLTPWFE